MRPLKQKVSVTLDEDIVIGGATAFFFAIYQFSFNRAFEAFRANGKIMQKSPLRADEKLNSPLTSENLPRKKKYFVF